MAVTESEADPRQVRLTTKREPKSKNASIGDMATRDAIIVVALAWAALFLLHYSLRHHIL